MKKTQTLPQAIVLVAKQIVNRTADGELGYADAADAVAENWGDFQQAGATVNDIERITGLIRWWKHEGFCTSSPMT